MKKFLVEITKAEIKTNDLKGQTAFGTGKIKGEVVKVLDIRKSSKNLKGKILVTTQTTPFFIPYLKGVKAIITDEGGITCHAAIISREMKIPCIVGTRQATKHLKNGDVVELDLLSGIIKK